LTAPEFWSRRSAAATIGAVQKFSICESPDRTH
jgi:hypothetical protein